MKGSREGFIGNNEYDNGPQSLKVFYAPTTPLFVFSYVIYVNTGIPFLYMSFPFLHHIYANRPVMGNNKETALG
jgi:hypothetical protein